MTLEGLLQGPLSAEDVQQLQECRYSLLSLQQLLDFIVSSQVQYLQSLCKLSYITQRIFLYLIFQGFCGKSEGDEDEQQQQEDDKYFDGDGCGMGDGQGENNVSNEIEHEEQLEGLKNYESEEENQQ